MASRGPLVASVSFALLAGCGGGDGAKVALDAALDAGAEASLDAETEAAADAGLADAPAPSIDADAPSTVFFGGTIYRRNSDLAILGAEVCLFNQPQIGCELTDSLGRFRFAVPMDTSLAATVRAPGFGGTVIAFRTGRADLTGYTITLPTEGQEHGYYAAAGVEWPSTTRGFLYVFARDLMGQQLAGLTMGLSPTSGKGPFYDNETGAPDGTLQATSAAGTGHFGGVGPGETEVTFGPSNLVCSATVGGWPSKDPSTVRVPIVAGFETLVGVRCF
jgi:hypothetical protein